MRAFALVGMKAFVIALGRAGEDAKAFKITDVEGTFASFAGADYDIQVRHSNYHFRYFFSHLFDGMIFTSSLACNISSL
jgi:hypothetical protein